MSRFALSTESTVKFAEVDRVIAFIDLTGFDAQSARLSDFEMAAVLNAYYETAGAIIAAAGGTVIKFMGDAALITFPIEDAHRAVRGLQEAKAAVDRMMRTNRWDCRLVVKAHCGRVVAGDFGAGQGRRHDVVGKAVNFTARLSGAGDIVLSSTLAERLGPEPG